MAMNQPVPLQREAIRSSKKKSAAPIYVESLIETDMDAIWAHTQSPELHEQWDLRFSEIRYLPRPDETKPQLFQYKTRIGFGLHIEGTGESIASRTARNGTRTSTLVFGSEQRMSLIRTGSGFWQYTPTADGVRFVTQYDYQTRFGAAGKLFDRLLFRPLFGYATAWSFELLRIWLEQKAKPSVVIRHALIHYGCLLMLAFVWGWMGLVPKLLANHPEELELLRGAGWFDGYEPAFLKLLGIAEVGIGLLAVRFHRYKASYWLQLLILAALASSALAVNPQSASAPFNPIVITLPMAGLCLIALLTKDGLPRASLCIREPWDGAGRTKREGWRNGVDL